MSGATTPTTPAFRHPDDEQELARLQRLTGLEFDTVPESLIHPAPARKKQQTTMPATGTENRSQKS